MTINETNQDFPVGSSNNPSHKIFTVANVVTMCRMALTFVFLYLFVTGENRVAAIVVYAIAASTDWMDGQIARRTQTVSWFGKLLDPICDRMLLFTGVLGLVLTHELPVWIAVFIIGRDCYLALGAKLLQNYRKRPIDVVYIGKVATAFLMFGFTLMLLGQPVLPALNIVHVSWFPLLNNQPGALGLLFVYVGCICSAITAGVYTKIALEIKSEAEAK